MQALQDQFGGWNSDQIVPIFAQYASTVFEAFGEYVTHWTTVNEPWTFCFLGYGQGSGAPGINDKVEILYKTCSCLRDLFPYCKEDRWQRKQD